jgi:uncharacterized membrane protein HdeD (DUF308 family)
MATELANSVVSALTARWWTLVLRGIAAILFGVLAFVVPESRLLALVLLWGAFAVVNGVFALALAAARGREGLRWGWLFFEGIASIAAGVLTFVWPGITAQALLIVIAAWAVLTGGAEIATAIRLRHVITDEWLLAASGVLSIAFGALLVAAPESGALALAWMIGAYAVLFGVLLIGLGVRLNQLRRNGNQLTASGRAATPA